MLIDDNPSYAVECANAGIHVLLYDWEHGYPWSKTDNGPAHDLITRCVCVGARAGGWGDGKGTRGTCWVHWLISKWRVAAVFAAAVPSSQHMACVLAALRLDAGCGTGRRWRRCWGCWRPPSNDAWGPG